MTDTKDRLAEIQQWYEERTRPGGTIPFDGMPIGYAQDIVYMGWLLDEIDRLRERCEAYKGQVKAGSDEIERLRADGLRVTGITHRGKVT